jgi:DNA-binding transcriptional MerR regulator
MALTIGRIARATGVPAKTIRYYEQVGVLPPPRRTAAGYREYTDQSVERLRFVRRARELGLSLQHLKTLIPALDGACRTEMRPRLLTLVRAHEASVEQRIGELRRLARQLAAVRRRLSGPPRARPAGRCRCLDVDDPLARADHRARR